MARKKSISAGDDLAGPVVVVDAADLDSPLSELKLAETASEKKIRLERTAEEREPRRRRGVSAGDDLEPLHKEPAARAPEGFREAIKAGDFNAAMEMILEDVATQETGEDATLGERILAAVARGPMEIYDLAEELYVNPAAVGDEILVLMREQKIKVFDVEGAYMYGLPPGDPSTVSPAVVEEAPEPEAAAEPVQVPQGLVQVSGETMRVPIREAIVTWLATDGWMDAQQLAMRIELPEEMFFTHCTVLEMDGLLRRRHDGAWALTEHALEIMETPHAGPEFASIQRMIEDSRVLTEEGRAESEARSALVGITAPPEDPEFDFCSLNAAEEAPAAAADEERVLTHPVCLTCGTQPARGLGINRWGKNSRGAYCSNECEPELQSRIDELQDAGVGVCYLGARCHYDVTPEAPAAAADPDVETGGQVTCASCGTQSAIEGGSYCLDCAPDLEGEPIEETAGRHLYSQSGPLRIDEQPDGALLDIPVGAIRVSPYQVRQTFDEGELADLAEDIRQRGVLQPVVVRPGEDGGAELVMGERRLRAAKIAGLPTIPALVRRMDSEAAMSSGFVENILRSNLRAMEEAGGYRRLIDEFGYTQSRVAELVKRSPSAVANALRLLQLPEPVRALIDSGQLGIAHGLGLMRFVGVASELTVIRMANLAVEQNSSSRDLQKGVPFSSTLGREGLLREYGLWSCSFDMAICKECPFGAYMVEGGYSYCFNPPHFDELQREALLAREQREEAAIAAARTAAQNPDAVVGDEAYLRGSEGSININAGGLPSWAVEAREEDGEAEPVGVSTSIVLPLLSDMRDFRVIRSDSPTCCQAGECECAGQGRDNSGAAVRICTVPRNYQQLMTEHSRGKNRELLSELDGLGRQVYETMARDESEINQRAAAVIAVDVLKHYTEEFRLESIQSPLAAACPDLAEGLRLYGYGANGRMEQALQCFARVPVGMLMRHLAGMSVLAELDRDRAWKKTHDGRAQFLAGIALPNAVDGEEGTHGTMD